MPNATAESAGGWNPAAVGARLEAARIALGKSREEVYELLGVTKGTYSSYIHGGFAPKPDRLYAYVRLGVSVDWLFYGIENGLTVRMSEALRSALPEAERLIAEPAMGRSKRK